MHKAWPIILANSAVPALGLVDTAIMGHLGSVSELAALSVATLMFSFIYWSFGFLRMATTAFVAQADGAKQEHAMMLVVLQSACIALGLALALIVLQRLVLIAGLGLLAPPNGVAVEAVRYFDIRIWSAPATLITYVISGYLIGRGFTKQLLVIQVCLNGSNALLNYLFVSGLELGIGGIAWGTFCAEYLTACLGVFLILRRHSWYAFAKTLDLQGISSNLKRLLGHNRDIFLRTLSLLLGFAFFTRTGASFGEEILAANYILLQLISFSAFFLDGYAQVLESLVGRSVGQKSVSMLKELVRKCSVLALLTAALLSSSIFFAGTNIVSWLTDKPILIELAASFLPYTAAYIGLSVAAFQLDGIFIGAAYGSALRNCSFISTATFLFAWYAGLDAFQNSGLWLAFIIYVCVRALTLGMHWPKLLQRCRDGV